MKKRKKLLLFPLAIVAILWSVISLAGCKSISLGKSAQPAAAIADEYAARDIYNKMEYGYAATEAAMPAESAADAGNSEKTVSGAVTDTATFNKAAANNRKLIRDVAMDVETTEFDPLLSQITAKINELGGYVESSNISGKSVNSYDSSQQRYADIKARIPADRLDSFIETVQTSGNVTSKSEQVTDVTLQYSDIESRRNSLKIEQDRLWALLEKADTLEAVIALEARLSDIRYELESYESQLKLYDNQVTYSTVSMYVYEVKTFTPAAPDSISTRIQKGFSRSINNMADTGIAMFVWILSNSPFLLLWAAIICIVVLTIKRIRKRIGFSIRKKKASFYEQSIHMKQEQNNQEIEENDKAENEK